MDNLSLVPTAADFDPVSFLISPSLDGDDDCWLEDCGGEELVCVVEAGKSVVID